MTHIPGTSQPKYEIKPDQKTVESKVIGVYKKADKIPKKIAAKSSSWYLNQKYWIWAGFSLSLVSVILGFIIYKSFFILAIFFPLSLLAIWFVIKFFEETISKFDSLK